MKIQKSDEFDFRHNEIIFPMKYGMSSYGYSYYCGYEIQTPCSYACSPCH